jgi:hypothetical protein
MYNDKRQMTRQEYFGVNGPAKRPDNAAYLIETQYDVAGHKTQVRSVDVSGLATVDQYDVQGRLTAESYYNAQGKPVPKKGDTYATVSYERTDQEQKLTIRYLGADGKPVVAKGGCAVVNQDLDAKRKLIKAVCLDTNGHLMESQSNMGAATLTYVRDASEQVIGLAAFGPDGKPALTTNGYTRIALQYDAAGTEVHSQLWLLSGESIVRQFDSKGKVTQESYEDAQGKPELAKGDTYAEVRYDRTDDGRNIVTHYLAADGKPVVPKNGCATENEQLDANGHLLRDACLDASGKPMVSQSTLGAALLTYVRDASGKAIQMEGFGPDGKPVETLEGFARLAVTEDSKGTTVQSDYFDRNGVLILRITPQKPCDLSAGKKSLAGADCIIADASRTVLKSGDKKYVLVVASVNTSDQYKGTALLAQMHVGDVLLENDGISTPKELLERFTSGPDQVRKLVFLRDGKQMTVQIPKGQFGALLGVTLSNE